MPGSTTQISYRLTVLAVTAALLVALDAPVETPAPLVPPPPEQQPDRPSPVLGIAMLAGGTAAFGRAAFFGKVTADQTHCGGPHACNGLLGALLPLVLTVGTAVLGVVLTLIGVYVLVSPQG